MLLVGSSASASDFDDNFSLDHLDHKRRSHKRNRKKWTRSESSDSESVKLIYDSAYDCYFWFSLGHKHYRDSDYNSKSHSDSVAGENQPLKLLGYQASQWNPRYIVTWLWNTGATLRSCREYMKWAMRNPPLLVENSWSLFMWIRPYISCKRKTQF